MAKPKNTNIMKDLAKNKEVIDNLHQQVNGYTQSIDKIIDPNVLDKINFDNITVNSNRSFQDTLTNMKGRDIVDSKFTISEKIMNILAQNTISRIDLKNLLNDRLALNDEFDYLIANMPELGDTLKTLAEDVVYCNNATETAIELRFGGVTTDNSNLENKYTKYFKRTDDIISTINAKRIFNYDIEKETKELVYNVGKYGYQIIAQIPYSVIVNDLLYMKETLDNKKKGYAQSGEAILLAMSENSDKLFNQKSRNKDVSINIEKLEIFSEAHRQLLSSNIKNIVQDETIPYSIQDIDYVMEHIKENIHSYEESSIDEDSTGVGFNLTDIFNGDSTSSESTPLDTIINKRNKKFRIDDIKGATYDVLDVSKTIPIFIKNELLGVYIVENETTNSDSIVKVGQTISSAIRNNSSTSYNSYETQLKTIMLDDIGQILQRNISKKFLRNNVNVVEDIEYIIGKAGIDEVASSKVRFIPAEYLTLFTIGDGLLGTPLLMNARVYAHMHINLLKSDVAQKMIYDKDRYTAAIKNNGDVSQGSQIEQALLGLSALFPSANSAALPDFASYGGIGTRVALMPTTTSGEKLIELEKMDIAPATDNTDTLKQLRNAATRDIGYPYDLLDPTQNVDFAKKITNINMQTLTRVVGIQRELEIPLSEFCTKRLQYVTGDENVSVVVKFNPPSELTSNITAEGLDKVTARIGIINDLITADPDLTDKKKEIVKYRLLKDELKKYVNIDVIDEIIREIKLDKGATSAGGEEL